jgi:hypothetical protein
METEPYVSRQQLQRVHVEAMLEAFNLFNHVNGVAPEWFVRSRHIHESHFARYPAGDRGR